MQKLNPFFVSSLDLVKLVFHLSRKLNINYL